jgi:Fur family transcriptional regulator, ferric uptake regulator
MTCSPAHLAQQIRDKGFRLTPQRMAIMDVLYAAGGHLSATEIYARVHVSAPGLTEPTVYRTLEFLSENGFALSAHVGGGKLVYQVAGHDHHHVICRECGVEMEVPHAQLEALYQHIEQSTGYRLTTSHLTFFGLCPGCQ